MNPAVFWQQAGIYSRKLAISGFFLRNLGTLALPFPRNSIVKVAPPFFLSPSSENWPHKKTPGECFFFKFLN